MEPLFSRRQSTRGDGLPEALHERVAFSPSRTETSPSDVPELSISGGTAGNREKEEKKKKKNFDSTTFDGIIISEAIERENSRLAPIRISLSPLKAFRGRGMKRKMESGRDRESKRSAARVIRKPCASRAGYIVAGGWRGRERLEITLEPGAVKIEHTR